MATGNRIRRVLDVGRLAALLAGPGSDTRSWIALARVDDDADAVRFEAGYGWIADITFTSGELSTEGPVAARIMSPFGGPEEGAHAPVNPGAEVVIAIVDGNPNVQCIVLGYLNNPTDETFPTTVNGTNVTEALAKEKILAKTPAGLSAEFGPEVHVSAQQEAAFTAPDVRLAEKTASQPFVRGNDLQSAEQQLVSALNAYATALAPAGPPATPVTLGMTQPAATALALALTAFSNAIAASLSTRIRGE